MQNEKVRDLISSLEMYHFVDTSRRMSWWVGCVARIREESASPILVVKPEEIIWKPRDMWEDKVKIDIRHKNGGRVCIRCTSPSIGISSTLFWT